MSDSQVPSYAHEVPGGAAWSAPARAGRLVTLTALGDDANACVLVLGADRVDRLNLPDTLKAQMSARVRPPMVLMSDRGLALASVVASTLDWHDALTGFGHDAHLERHGPTSYADDSNDWRRSARTGLVSELTKLGLDERDLHGCVNFFSRVDVADDARATLTWAPGHARTGDSVTLRTEQDVVVVLSTAPHPMSTATWAPAAVRVEVAPAPVVDPATDASWTHREESARALQMTRRVLA